MERVSAVTAIVFLAMVSAATAIRYVDCGATKNVFGVKVQGCDTEDVCPLHRGKNATISVSFKALSAFSKATGVVHAKLGLVDIPFPIPNPNGCESCGLTCPVAANTNNTYTTNIFIQSSYPKVEVTVTWELKDEKKNDIFCVKIPVAVVDA